MANKSAAPRLEGKVAVITGGASGIGACTARLFHFHGAKVVIADIQDELGRSVADELGHDKASFIHCDVTVEEDVSGAVDHAVEKFGKLDIMFNNAGVCPKAKASIFEVERSELELTHKVNVVGPFYGTKHAARVMIPARQGAIVNTSSLASLMAVPMLLSYACSKTAVASLTKNTAVELGQYGIRVNCVSLSSVDTPLARNSMGLDGAQLEAMASTYAPLKGVVLKAEDIAAAVLFLASDDSRYITGHNLPIDGGISIPYPRV